MLGSLKDKKIAIVGLGTNNKMLAEFLTRQGITFKVVEWQSPEQLAGQLDGFDLIFRTPGLPYLSKAIQQAKKNGTEISSQTKLFFQLCPSPIIGVTGTKGKGTTSSLIAKILQAAGKKVWLGGNIGRDPFEFLDRIQKQDFVVLELSSFQLQDMTQSPHIAIVLNITSDHLNHHLSQEEYVTSKSSIVAFQTDKDFAVLHKNLPEWFKDLGGSKKIIFDAKDAISFATKLLGEHNLENIAAAVGVAQILKIDQSIIRKTVSAFEALPHRLKVIKEINGVTFVDDGFSTNIDPTIAAVQAFQSPLVLIAGGFDKGLDFTALGEKIKQSPNIKGLVVIGQVTDKIINAVNGFKGQILTGAKTMGEILQQAESIASPGDTILFSPGTSSFDMFKNEKDRADQFVNAIAKHEEN